MVGVGVGVVVQLQPAVDLVLIGEPVAGGVPLVAVVVVAGVLHPVTDRPQAQRAPVLRVAAEVGALQRRLLEHQVADHRYAIHGDLDLAVPIIDAEFPPPRQVDRA